MSKYVDPFTDVGFKIVFGKENISNDILISFLNALLENEEDFSPIRKLRYLNNERSKEQLNDRSVIYDILCETDNGHRFIVEMQRQSKPHFFGRAVYYMSRAIYEQGLKSLDNENDDWNYDVIPVIGVFFCNFYVKGLEHKLVQHLRLCDTETHKPIGNLMRYLFIQFPAFKKSKEECDTEFSQWIYILKNMRDMQTMPFTSHREIFERLAKVSSVAGLSPEERRQYDYDVKKARDYKEEMAQAKIDGRAEGRAEGLAEGRVEGRAEEKRDIASAMKKMGLDLLTIEQVTGLSRAEIADL